MSTMKTHHFVKIPQNVCKCPKHAALESCSNFETGAIGDLLGNTLCLCLPVHPAQAVLESCQVLPQELGH